jgi:hypothetical protein
MSFLYALLHGQQDPIFEDKIYQPVGMMLLLSTLFIVVIYYFGFNGLRAKFSKKGYWYVFLISDMILNFLAVIFIVRALGGDHAGPFSFATLLLCLINAFYAGIVFFVFSSVLKMGSPHARRTPF